MGRDDFLVGAKGDGIWYSQIGSKIGEYQDEYPQIDIHKSQIGAYQNFGPKILP